MPEHTRDGRANRRTDGDRRTLADCDHTNPYTGEGFGDAMVYHRGPVVVADGGETRVADRADDSDGEQSEGTADGHAADAEDETLADIDHTPPRDAADANRVHERGGEGPDGV